VSVALAKAVDYQARHAWSVLPLQGKEPNHALIRHTRGGSSWKTFTQRPADVDEIHAWFRQDAGTNIGIVCGEVSGGLAVLDQDADLPADVRVPTTALVATGRGSQSYFHSDGPAPSRDFSWGELRGENRYVCAPPSLHPSGVRYCWVLDPETFGIAPLDELVLPRVEPVVSRDTCPTRANSVLLGTGARLADVEVDEAAAVTLADALGVTVPLGRSFRCVLHPERRASATIWRPSDCVRSLYHDWHRSAQWLSFALVRASLAGRPCARGPELATWKLRLLAEAGLVEPGSRRRSCCRR
jgi:Bifunctional DNA primase/polymerase, N-terminal